MAEIWGAAIAAVAAVGATAASIASRPGTPGAPDYAAATREGVQADIDTLPLRRMIDAAAHTGGTVLKQGYTSKQIGSSAELQAKQQTLSDLTAQLATTPATLTKTGPPGRNGQPATTTTEPNPAYATLQAQLSQAQTDLAAAAANPGNGQPVTQYYDAAGRPVSKSDAVLADFTGYGDADLARANLAFQAESADTTAASMLALQKKYGPEFIAERLKELELSDPTGFRLRNDMGRQISDQLALGSRLDPSMEAQVQQAQRAGQAARGNILGDAPAASEALATGDAGYRLWQQRLANASSFLSGTTPVAQFGQIAGAQQGASPYAAQNPAAGLGLNPNAGAQSAQFANQQYSTQAGLYSTQVATNPWAGLFGGFANTATGLGGALAWQGAGLPTGKTGG